MFNKIYGYKYDEAKKELIVDEAEAEVIKTAYDLIGNYKLYDAEVEAIIKGTKSVYQVIKDRIDNICNILSQYNQTTKKTFDFSSIIKILKEDKEINKKVIGPLLKMKKDICKLDSTAQETLLTSIDNVIELINNIDEITNKYPRFRMGK